MGEWILASDRGQHRGESPSPWALPGVHGVTVRAARDILGPMQPNLDRPMATLTREQAFRRPVSGVRQDAQGAQRLGRLSRPPTAR